MLVTPDLRRRRRPAVPPLQNGDNLTRAEFLRRYEAMPSNVKAELIGGIVYMAAALSHDFHSGPHFDLIGLLSIYRFATPGVVGGDNGTVILQDTETPQPDIYVMLGPGFGGRATVDADGYVIGPPELVIEVANTSADYDLHQKLHVYRRAGVPEYAIWRTLDDALDYFALDGDTYRRVPVGPDGVIRSVVLPGLWLNVTALLASDWSAVMTDLHRGIASPEHAAFVAELRRRGGGSA